MSWHTLFWMLSTVVVAYVVMAVVAVMRAHREDAAHRLRAYRRLSKADIRFGEQNVR